MSARRWFSRRVAESQRPGSGRFTDPRCQTAAKASPALALRVAFDQTQPGCHRRLAAWRSIASSSGSAPISRTSCAQRQATAILAAHCSASSREGTWTSVNQPMASGYGPSVTAPPAATMLAGWGICFQMPCRGRPSVNREYSAGRDVVVRGNRAPEVFTLRS